MVSPLFSYLVTQAQILVLRGAPSNLREMLSLVRSGRFEGAERAHFQDTPSVGFSLSNEQGIIPSLGECSRSIKVGVWGFVVFSLGHPLSHRGF